MKNQLDKLISEYSKLQPFEEDCKKKLDKKFRLEFNYNSNHLEGNTLTYGETELLLLFDQTKGGHELRELEEMKAHDVALMMIKEEAADKGRPLTERFIKDLNQTILVRPFWKDAITADGQSSRRQIKVGEYKEYPNSVIQSNGEVFEYASPQETPILMAELAKWYNDEAKKGELTPVELAALLHYRYIRIHPFDDGNGRVARLLVNYILYCNNLPLIIIKTAEKREYLRALQQADAGDLQAFINYMIQQLAWSLDLSIRAAKGESVEEQDDWEKQLSLLKKGLGKKDNKVVKKSEESLKNIYENVITDFCNSYDNRISKYNNLFIDFSYQLTTQGGSYQGEGIPECLKNIYKAKSQYMEIGNVLYIKATFCNLIRPYKEGVFESDLVKFIFDENVYMINYKENKCIYSYDEFPTELEMNTIISNIGKDLLQKIENAINS
jgi:Uncharacterized conserved protein